MKLRFLMMTATFGAVLAACLEGGPGTPVYVLYGPREPPADEREPGGGSEGTDGVGRGAPTGGGEGEGDGKGNGKGDDAGSRPPTSGEGSGTVPSNPGPDPNMSRCGDLGRCCAELEESGQRDCNATAESGDAAACRELLQAAQQAGLCN